MVQHEQDLALARLVVAGDRRAFDRLFELVFARLYRFVLLRDVRDHLPLNYRTVLEWKYVDGLDATSIGQRLNVSASAAHSLVARARHAFRTEFEAIVGELAGGAALENPR